MKLKQAFSKLFSLFFCAALAMPLNAAQNSDQRAKNAHQDALNATFELFGAPAISSELPAVPTNDPFIDAPTTTQSSEPLREQILNKSLNYTNNLANNLATQGLSALYSTSRARLNFALNRQGKIAGSGDVLLPLYDDAKTTVFTQFGARRSSWQWSGRVRLAHFTACKR